MRLLGSGGALEKDDGIRPKLKDHLPAGPARRTCNSMIVRNRNRSNLDPGAGLGDSGEDCGPLGAIRHSIGSVLDIATRKYLSVG